MNRHLALRQLMNGAIIDKIIARSLRVPRGQIERHALPHVNHMRGGITRINSLFMRHLAATHWTPNFWAAPPYFLTGFSNDTYIRVQNDCEIY